MTPFTVGDHQYRPRKMDAKTQFHVARRLTPFMSGLIAKLPKEAIEAALSKDGAKIDIAAINPLEMMEPLIQGIGAMSDADADYILDHCLEHCDRSAGNDTGWGPVKVPGAKIQFSDIGMAEMLQISWKVIQGNLANFFPAQPPNSDG